MHDRTDQGAVAADISVSTRSDWRARLSRRGLSERSCAIYGGRLSRVEQALRQEGASLATCSGAQITAAVLSIDWSPFGREQFRAALVHGLGLLGRLEEFPDLCDLVPIPERTKRRSTSKPRPRRRRQKPAPGSASGVAAFEATGVSHGTACRYVRILAAAAGVLAGLGQDVGTCDEKGIAALGEAIPASRRALLRRALIKSWAVHGRDDRPPLSGLSMPSRSTATRGAAAKGPAVPADEARALLKKLNQGGYTRTFLAKRLGVSTEVLRARGQRVNADLAGQLGELADELLFSGRAGPGSHRWGGPRVPLDERFNREALMGTGASPKTAANYTRVLARISAQLREQGKDVATATTRDIAQIAETFPNTNSSRAQIRGALTRAWEILERPDPPSLRAVRVPPRPRARSRALAHDAAVTLERAAWDRNDDKGLATVIGLYSGLRRAEIAGLRWEDIKTEPDGSWWITVIGKGSVKADVPVHPHLVDALARRRRPAGWLFPGRFGGPVTPSTIWRWTKTVAAEAGLEHLRRFSTHILRHTALTEANDASNNLRGVQEFARHSRPEITAIYTRLSAKQLIDTVSSIDYGRGPASQGPEPDPADLLSTIGYRRLVTVVEGERTAAAWVALGLAAAAAGWRLELIDAPGLQWVHPTEPRITACAGVDTLDLLRQAPEGKDWAEMWELPTPHQLLALAELLVSEAPAPVPSVYLGRPDGWPDDGPDDGPGPIPFGGPLLVAAGIA